MTLRIAFKAAFLGVFAITAAAAGAACHAEEPTSPSGGLTKPVDPPTMPDLGRGAPRFRQDALYNVYVGEALARTCSGPAPFFEFDSTDPKKDQPTMQMLATCMIDGPLKGKTIKLIGHTDPRGSENYNDKLGLERAESVKQYLVSHGVNDDRVQVASAGEEQAGQSPEQWRKDRRVEVQLVP